VADFFIRAQTGRPYNAVLGLDRANVGRTYQRPDAVGNPNHGLKTPDQWFDTSMFAMPALYTYGNTPRNFLRGPGFVNFDWSLFKNFAVTERFKVQFRWETFNTLNHFNPNNPNSSLTYNFTSGAQTTANFGTITGAQIDPRRAVLSVRFKF